MSISYSAIRNECRRRMIAASKIDPETQLQLENNVFSTDGKSLWIAEYCIGGTETQLSTKRSRISGFLIQYDIHAPENSGSDAVEETTDVIADCFDTKDPAKSSFKVGETDILVLKIKKETKKNTGTFAKSVLLTLDVTKNG